MFEPLSILPSFEKMFTLTNLRDTHSLKQNDKLSIFVFLLKISNGSDEMR